MRKNFVAAHRSRARQRPTAVIAARAPGLELALRLRMPAARSNQASGRWSWSLGTLGGVDVRVHGTFLLVLAWLIVSHRSDGHDIATTIRGIATMLTVFGVVVLHELGHALVARRFGIRTRDITLYPIGGVARLERMPSEPRQELLVAVAGPAVNVVLALCALVAIGVTGALWSPNAITMVGGPLLAKFFWLNVGMTLFNLLPAFPMDGGRVLRALLAMRVGRIRATDIAARIGQWIALGLGLLGFFGNPTLVFIALFVWIGAGQEAAFVHLGAALETVRVGDAMVTSFETLPATASVAHGLERAIHTTQRDFPVIDGGHVVGFVSARDLLQKVYEGAMSTPVGGIAHPVAEAASPEELVEPAFERLQQANAEVLPVLDAGRLVGLLLPANVLQLAGARDGWRAHAGRTAQG